MANDKIKWKIFRSSGNGPTWAVLVGLIVLITLGVSASVVADSWFHRDISVAMTSAVMATLGTFFGATYAFLLNSKRESDKIADEQRAAINSAIFVLFTQLNAVHAHIRQWERRKSTGHLPIGVVDVPPDIGGLQVDLPSLQFFLDAGEFATLQALYACQTAFNHLFLTITARGDFMDERVFPALTKLRGENDATVTLRDFKVSYPSVFSQAEMTVRNIDEMHNLVSPLLVDAIAKVRDVGVKLFAGTKFLELTDDVTPDPANPLST